MKPHSIDLPRREFLRRASTSAVVLAGAPSLLSAAEAKSKTSETLVTEFYKTLNETQRTAIMKPFDDPLRSKVDNNWFISDARVAKSFDSDQQAMIREIFMSMHSEEYAHDVMKQVESDAGQDGFGECSVALFGEPGVGEFEFVLTGRHVTRRCDGDSLAGTAFGGPIFYGHAVKGTELPNHPGNAYWYQAKQANQVFQALDGKQRESALLGRSRRERATRTVELTGKREGLPGIRMSELSGDQGQLVRAVIGDVLAPFREQDVQESLKLVDENGFENLHMAFFKSHDLGDDGVWDVWQIEGPSMLMFFRGSPHVHAWIHIKDQA